VIFTPLKIANPGELSTEVEKRLLGTAGQVGGEVDAAVRDILENVRTRGDEALIEYSKQFDDVVLSTDDLLINPNMTSTIAELLDAEVAEAIDGMIANVTAFHSPQVRRGYSIEGPEGSTLAYRIRPLASVGVYVPGGRAAYPTTVVMNVVPAQLAGVPRIVVFTPPGSVTRNPAIAYALTRLGVSEVVGLGGAQAVAAAAFGTETIRPVDKIVGPGNAYVAAAKRQLFGVVGIDSVAGPSEVVIVADESAPADWIARDLLAQAEHDPDARALLITPSDTLANAVSESIRGFLAEMPRREIASQAISNRGANCLVADIKAAVELSNRIAPEHLQVMVQSDTGLTPSDFVAGAIFWGRHSPTAVGDYWAGPNHVLPTGSTARFSGPLCVDDFTVATSVVQYSEAAAATGLGPAQRLAEAEGLFGHAEALRCRTTGDDE
jgi:histidinol dehydrogenase